MQASFSLFKYLIHDKLQVHPEYSCCGSSIQCYSMVVKFEKYLSARFVSCNCSISTVEVTWNQSVREGTRYECSPIPVGLADQE